MSRHDIPLSKITILLILTVQRFFEGGDLADVDVKCGDHTWKLHKAILCARSVWFKKALTGPFKTTRLQEGTPLPCRFPVAVA